MLRVSKFCLTGCVSLILMHLLAVPFLLAQESDPDSQRYRSQVEDPFGPTLPENDLLRDEFPEDGLSVDKRDIDTLSGNDPHPGPATDFEEQERIWLDQQLEPALPENVAAIGIEPTMETPVERNGSRRMFSHLAESPGLLPHKTILDLLKYRVVIEDLEVVDSQLVNVSAIEKDQSDRRREELREIMESADEDVGPAEITRRMNELQREIRVDREDGIQEELLPMQVERLDQISLQIRIQSEGLIKVFNTGSVAEDLGIDDVQMEELKSCAVECSREFDAELLELKRRLKEKMLSVLDDKQASEFEEMLGEEFILNSGQNER